VAKTIPDPEIKTNGVGAAEKFDPDPNYGNRKGYNPNFLGVPVPLPQLSNTQRKAAAANLKAKDNDDPNEFKYQHFSLFMHAKRRLAFYTAVNIDGGSVVTINRKTGKVTGGPESAEAREKWYDDDRIDPEEVCEDNLYKDEPQMKFFQRGHLVKRTDPSWGTEAKAFKGQADTFHFTNCSPQHFKFNPIKTKWAGLEDWISNTSDDDNIRVTVFSGPVFANSDPKISYLQIPKAFWKVIAWVEDGALRATGVIADQSKLLQESGIGGGESLGKESLDELPDNLPVEYHCSIKFLEKKTGLDFGDLSDVDTFKKGESVGGEEIKRVTEFSQIVKRKKELEILIEE
jgi:endonuclease G